MAELTGNEASEDAAIGPVMELERAARTGSGAATLRKRPLRLDEPTPLRSEKALYAHRLLERKAPGSVYSLIGW
jgi:hypothetical protein